MKQNLQILIVLLVFAVPVAFAFSIEIWIDNQTIIHHDIVEQFSIRNVEFLSNNSATVTVENAGPKSEVYTVVFVSAKINGINATLTPSGSPAGTLKSGVVANFTVTLQGDGHFIPDNTYKFQLRTMKGTMADYTVTYNQTNCGR